MPYSQFKTLKSIKDSFGIQTKEGIRFIPDRPVITISETLKNFLAYSLPVAVATGTEKIRSELIISPILLEVRQILGETISFFSGEEFNVDEPLGFQRKLTALLKNNGF
jgi:hypothetical protein